MPRQNEIILAVVNPISGNNDKEPIIKLIKSKLSASQSLDILETTGQNDKEAINRAIQRIKPHRIIAVGGDGTIKLIAETYPEERPIIGIIAAGSANGLATDLDLPDNLEDAVSVALGNRCIELDNLCIGDHLCLHISDMGLNANLISHYSDQSVRGYLGYALSMLPTLPTVNDLYKFQIVTPSKTMETEAIMVAFANCKMFGTGVIINPDAKVDDGKFEVLIFKNFNALEVIKTLQGNISMNPEFVEVIQTTEVKVSCDRPIPFQIDGESCGNITETYVKIIPGNMKVAVG